MIEADRADYNRAKLDHDLIVAITSPIPKYATFREAMYLSSAETNLRSES